MDYRDYFNRPRDVRECSNPNITGNIKARTQGGQCDGVFSYGGSFQGIDGVNYNTNGVWFSFSLKESNSIYSGDTLQPPAFQALIIIKV